MLSKDDLDFITKIAIHYYKQGYADAAAVIQNLINQASDKDLYDSFKDGIEKAFNDFQANLKK